MRTETIIKKIYTFDELPEATQEKAMEKLYDINTGYEWWECTYEDAKTIGLKIKSFDLDLNKHCEIAFILDAHEVADKIHKEHGETCDTYTLATDYLSTRDEAVNTAEKDENGDFVNEYNLDQQLDEIDEDFRKALQEEYASMLQQEADYLSSEESIKDTIEANEYEFDEEGNLA